MLGSTGELLSHNVYAYCANNPVMRVDESGAIFDTILDIVFCVVDVVVCIADPSVENHIALAADLACLAMPFVTGGGLIARAGFKAVNTVDNAVDAYNTIDNVTDAGKMVDNLCFVAGTLVSTKDGLRQIEQIKTGDYVWSEDPETGEIALKKVVRTFVNKTSTLIEINVNGTKIETTEKHRFWVEGKGWITAVNLKDGDILRLESGENVTISAVTHVELDAPVYVYNFEVQDWHTYFVSGDGVLVHNNCTPQNIFKSVKSAPNYPAGFKQAQNGLKKVNMNNGKLLDQLRGIEQGLWKKVYQNGWDAYGNKISIHYFQSKSGQVFDLKIVYYWS